MEKINWEVLDYYWGGNWGWIRDLDDCLRIGKRDNLTYNGKPMTIIICDLCKEEIPNKDHIVNRTITIESPIGNLFAAIQGKDVCKNCVKRFAYIPDKKSSK